MTQEFVNIRSTDVFLDFETYYDKDYNLKKLSIEEYVHDKRFEQHMLAIARGQEPVIVVDPPEIAKCLREYDVTNSDVRTFIQNGKYDRFSCVTLITTCSGGLRLRYCSQTVSRLCMQICAGRRKDLSMM